MADDWTDQEGARDELRTEMLWLNGELRALLPHINLTAAISPLVADQTVLIVRMRKQIAHLRDLLQKSKRED